MQQNYFKHALPALFVIGMALTSLTAFAQQDGRVVKGRVVDDSGQPIPGANIVVQGTTVGTVTDMDGNYSIKVSDSSDKLVFSFIGSSTQTVVVDNQSVIDVILEDDTKTLGDIVVIGYGTQRKGDLTGSVANVTADEFNQGLIGNAAQLINGKVSGVQILSSGGSPTSGSSIKIRGGASLNASNDPLIVLDGVPLENGGISGGSGNFLSLINPADIESMTVLKDASSTAIYGSRASNGVIIITTKKGSQGGLKIGFTTTNSLQKASKFADMLDRGEFADVVLARGSEKQKALLGDADTDMNSEIFKTAFGTDNNLSIAATAGLFPIRVSLGYYNQEGILLTDRAERLSGNFNVSPSLLDDHLKLNLGVKLSQNRNRFASTEAIWNAATWNPMDPIYHVYDEATNLYGGYFEIVDLEQKPVTGANENPLGLLEQTRDRSRVRRIVGNFDAEYKIHPLPELKVHLTLGYDFAQGQGNVDVPANALKYFNDGGRSYEYGPQELSNRLLTLYLNYNKAFDCSHYEAAHLLDITVGYDYQMWKSATPAYDTKSATGNIVSAVAASDQRHSLISYYGRLNYTLFDRYMVTATVRRDGTSRFSPDDRWGMFPSVAVAWRLTEEPIMQNIECLNNLKLRASYGVTGQQDGIGNYNYLPLYTVSQQGANYYFGDKLISTYRPEAYVANLTWETTKAWNFGVDFGFFKNRFNGSVEYYTRKTEDLLATVPSAAGTNFNKRITTNVGNVDSRGVEINLGGTPVDNSDWTVDLSFNATWQEQTVKNLSLVENGEITRTLVGPSIDSYQFMVLSEGEAPNKFYLYHQVYDQNGSPIEGAYADMNGDGLVNSSDLYMYHSPAPDWLFGLSANIRFRNLTLSTSLRANVGNYLFNGMSMNTGAFGTMSYNDFELNNLHKSYLDTKFGRRQYLSDYYIENASFLKMDNISLGYDFGRIKDLFSMNASVLVQNVFTLTNYSGIDPEVSNGLDVSFYPRPRIFSLSLGFEF